MPAIQMREAIRQAMVEEMRRDPMVFLMGEEVAYYDGAYKVSQGMLDEFGPDRVVDTPIAENGFAGLGVGAAGGGLSFTAVPAGGVGGRGVRPIGVDRLSVTCIFFSRSRAILTGLRSALTSCPAPFR